MTHIEISPKMVFADNKKEENDMSHYHHLTIEEREAIRRFIQEEHWSPEQIEKRFQTEENPL